MEAVKVPQTLEYRGGQLKLLHSSEHKPKPRLTKDFESKYNKVKAKLALLSSSASAPKNKCLIAEMYDWDEEEVSSDDNKVTKVKVLMALTDEERVFVGKESANHDEWVKISIQKHVNTKILKENQNLRNELKELTSITEAWLNSFNKVNKCISEQIPTQKKKILGIDQLTEDTSSSKSKVLVFVKSLTYNSELSITDSNKHKLSRAEDFTLSNHDTADESSVCSTPLPPLEKLTGAEPVSRPKTIKLILKSKSTFKAETLKGIIINKPSSAPAKGNKSSSASKTNSPPAGKLKNVKIENDPPLAIVIKELNELKLQFSKNKSSDFKNKNSQQNCETRGSNIHTTSNHNDIEWFRKRETLQAKNAESFKARKNKSSSALTLKTPTKSFGVDAAKDFKKHMLSD
nr:hypothetical protein [Tanacetum cinerariifolium]